VTFVVVVADNIDEQGLDLLRDEQDFEVVSTVGAPDQLLEELARAHALLVRSSTRVTEDLLSRAPLLRVVGRAGIGVDNIDLAAATASGICVMNTPFGNSITTAEHAVAMIFALARDIPEANASTKAGKWEKNRFMGVELTSKTLGIVGCGNIGSIVADRAHGLKMKVLAYDPYLTRERAKDLGVEKVELDGLLARSDFITLHTPLTDATRDIIDADAIARLKRGVRIVTCARGGLIVEEDLKAALESGHVAAAALDVFAEEPATDNVLFGMEQVVETPHLGAATAEAQENVALQVAEQMSDFLTTGAITNAINMASVSAEDAPRLAPFMRLAELLGSFAGQLTQTGLKAVCIEYEGEAAALNCRPLTQMALTGLLAPILDNVNMVSAPALARERNIDVTETKHERDCDYQTLIRLTVTTERGSRSVSGTLFGGDKPRIVEINGIGLEAELGPHMLYTVNADRPGFIGRLGSMLGEAGVNIATFNLGRTEIGGDAVALIQVDEPLDEAVLESVRALPDVVQARTLRF